MGKISGLRVVSKTTSNSFKDLDKSVPEIASELVVDAVVEANVMCLDDSVCVQFKLFSASPEEQLLRSKSYDSDMSNILNLYNWVIKDIADEIQLPPLD